jgi:AdoMet-dependent heme synthase
MTLTRPYDFLIQWHLTERCNLRCRHCYQEGGQSEELGFSAIERGIDEATQMVEAWQAAYDLEFSPSFNVTGGEPFLRPDLVEILESMVSRGWEVYLLSNGTLITSDRAAILAELGISGVQVSLEGPEKVHELIRGPGSFAAALNGVRHLLQAGVRVSLNTTLSRLNAPYFMDLVELAASLKVPRLGFSRLVPSGQGKDLLDQMLSPRQVQELYETAFALRVPGLEIVSGDPVAAQMSAPAEGGDSGAIPGGGCAAGVSGLTILPDGTVTPCRRLPLAIGNISREALREIWAAAPVLTALRDRSRYRGKCGTCGRWADCRGCRAIAYAYAKSWGTDDFLAPDPQCFIGGSWESWGAKAGGVEPGPSPAS